MLLCQHTITEHCSLDASNSYFTKLVKLCNTPPTFSPTDTPSDTPTATPTTMPTADPTVHPSATPSFHPTFSPSKQPSVVPTILPSLTPTHRPSMSPTMTPTIVPTTEPVAPHFGQDAVGMRLVGRVSAFSHKNFNSDIGIVLNIPDKLVNILSVTDARPDRTPPRP